MHSPPLLIQCKSAKRSRLDSLVPQFSISHRIPPEAALERSSISNLRFNRKKRGKEGWICEVLSQLRRKEEREKSPMSKESFAEREKHIAEEA